MLEFFGHALSARQNKNCACTPDDLAIGQHVVVLDLPLAGRAGELAAFW